MTDTGKRAMGHRIIEMPREEWERALAGAPEKGAERLAFMSPQHHLVEDLVVRDLPKLGRPMTPEWIADRLGFGFSRVVTLLEELEKGLFFLVRDASGSVCWSFPITVLPTPHRLRFASGERLYGA